MFTFTTKGEAAFVLSLLEAEGIQAEVLDGSGDIGGPATARLVVEQDKLEVAQRIVADFRKTSEPVKSPGKPFPFGTIVFWVTLCAGLVGCVAGVSAILDTPRDQWTTSKVLGTSGFFIFLFSLMGIFFGICLATSCAVIRIVWRKWAPA